MGIYNEQLWGYGQSQKTRDETVNSEINSKVHVISIYFFLCNSGTLCVAPQASLKTYATMISCYVPILFILSVVLKI